MRHPSPRRSVFALIILGLVVVAMGSILVRGEQDRRPEPSPTPVLADHPTLLVQLRDDWLRTVDNVVMGLTPATQGRAGMGLYVPGDVIVDLRSGMDETLASQGIQPIQTAGPIIAAQTGVRVDGTFVMDRLAFAGLVDSVGGVPVTISTPLVSSDVNGHILAVIPMGERVLDGPEAAMYALYLKPGHPEAERQARFAQVWESLLTRLPENPEKMRAILGNLGALARSTQDTPVLAEFLTQSGSAARREAWTGTPIAVAPGAVGPLPLEWIDPVPALLQAISIFPGALVDDNPATVRVRLYRGASTPLEVEAAAKKLQSQGFLYAWSGAATPPPATSVVAGRPQDLDAARRVATVLGANAPAVAVDLAASPSAPVTSVYTTPPPAVTGSASPTASASASVAASAPTSQQPGAADSSPPASDPANSGVSSSQ